MTKSINNSFWFCDSICRLLCMDVMWECWVCGIVFVIQRLFCSSHYLRTEWRCWFLRAKGGHTIRGRGREREVEKEGWTLNIFRYCLHTWFGTHDNGIQRTEYLFYCFRIHIHSLTLTHTQTLCYSLTQYLRLLCKWIINIQWSHFDFANSKAGTPTRANQPNTAVMSICTTKQHV